jgi:amidase
MDPTVVSHQDAIVDTTSDDALGDSDTVELLQRLARRDVSPAELTSAARDRLAMASPLNAVRCLVEPPPTPTDAPFAGIPTVLKDNEELEGYPTLQGSRAMPTHVATDNSVMTELLIGLGFDILAKTTMPEFGLTATTEPILGGATRNPWSTMHTPGGSSGGSAALAAAGVVPLAHANDGGGSIRIPAACCGLVGLKPSRGMMPTPLRMKFAPVKISVQGVLTRTVRDTAAFYAHITPAVSSIPAVGDVNGPGPRRLRIAMFTESVSGPVDPQVAEAVSRTAATLAEQGHHVESIQSPITLRFGKDFLRYWALLAWTIATGGRRLVGPDFAPEKLEPFSAGLAQYLREIAPGVPAALRRLRRFDAEYDSWFNSYDVLLSPVLGSPAPLLGDLGPDVDFRSHMQRLLPFAAFTAVQNVSGAPAISVPAGLSSEGLPLAVQLAGQIGSERTLLELAFELEQSAPWPTTPQSWTSAQS